MKSKIVAGAILVIVLSIGFNSGAVAHPCWHRGWHRACYPVARVYEPPVVVCDRPVVEYVHGRRYHPTPYCNRPVVFARESRTMPWYYVQERHAVREYPPVNMDRSCAKGNCYRR